MLLGRLADNTNERAVATHMRRRRFRLLLDLVDDLPRPVRLLDVGGSQAYWEQMIPELPPDLSFDVTLLNIEGQEATLPAFRSVSGDARSMPQFETGQFDVVFSNSTIEHVGPLGDQRRMAEEVRRIGRRYCVQTPNRGFPIEPHFLFPFWQFLPVAIRVALVRRFSLGWMARTPDPDEARAIVTSIRLLTKAELQQLFPDATIFEERFLGMVKSFVAHSRLPARASVEQPPGARCPPANPVG